MKLTVICMEKGGKVVVNQEGKPQVAYYTVFNSVVDSNEKVVGRFRLESYEQMHYKELKNYTIDINEHSGIEIIKGKA